MAYQALAVPAALVIACSAAAQVYNTNPDWQSSDTPVSTGGAFADLDKDGWLDFIVANGNDIQQQRLAVYYNQGDGTFPSTPDWQSSDIAYNGHVDVADVNGDGWLDVAVAHLGEFNTFAPVARLYLNNNGTLSSNPDWVADVIGNAFGCAFGDMNGDGRPDLAVATGWSYSPEQHYHNLVYANINGMLDTTPTWQSDDQNHNQGALWVDADNDGWQDLAMAGGRAYSSIYRNLGGTLETTASWQTSDGPNQDAIMIAAGDVNADGLADLFITDNTQLGGDGRFRQYDGQPGAMFNTSYSWSFYEGYGSALALADVNADGYLDLATGGWWEYTRLFLNDGAGLPANPSWNSGPSTVIEKIVFGDVNPACGVELVFTEHFDVGRAETRLFHLPHQPIQGLISVKRDGVEMTPDEYTWSRERGWIALGMVPDSTLDVTYTYSHSLDMGITNWGSSESNLLYYNLLYDDCNDNGVEDGCDIYYNTSQDVNGNGIPDECECPADVNQSGEVDIDDLFAALAAWGDCAGCPEDVNGDSVVDIDDVFAILSAWGPC